MKKLFIKIILSFLVLAHLQDVRASEVRGPYVLTDKLIQDAVSKENCLLILKEVHAASDEYLDSLHVKLEELKEAYNNLAKEITELEDGSENSLANARKTKEKVIEALYYNAGIEHEDFNTWSTEEKEAYIVQKDEYVEWSNYESELIALINQKRNELSQIENNYTQVLYEIENYQPQVVTDNNKENAANQAALYAYSAPILSVNEILLKEDTKALDTYLSQVNKYLKQIVPKAYSSLKFSDIFTKFSKVKSEDELQVFLNGKQNIELHEGGKELYSYAQELTLLDVEILASLAQLNYHANMDEEEYLNKYKEVLDIKESQWKYIYENNSEAFSYLATSLADFLNENSYTDETSLAKVKKLQKQYQMKLVWLVDNTWEVCPDTSSHFLEEFNKLNPLREETIIEELVNLSVETSSIEDSVKADETDNDSSDLDDIKQRLKESEENKLKDIPELPSAKSKLSTPKAPTIDNNNKKAKSNGSDKINLPKTGELRTSLIPGIVLLVVGICILLFQKRKKNAEKAKLDEIELD